MLPLQNLQGETELGEAWHHLWNHVSVCTKGDYSNDWQHKAWHGQQASVLFSRTPSSIRDDWKRWLILPKCCRNVEDSHSTLLGHAELMQHKAKWSRQWQSWERLGGLFPKDCFGCRGLQARKRLPSISIHQGATWHWVVFFLLFFSSTVNCVTI